MYVVCGVGDRGGVSRIMEDKCMLCVVLVVWRGQQEYGGQVYGSYDIQSFLCSSVCVCGYYFSLAKTILNI